MAFIAQIDDNAKLEGLEPKQEWRNWIFKCEFY